MSEKFYTESGYIIVKNKTLISACANQKDIVEFIKGNGIKVPSKSWWCVVEGVLTLETRPCYGLDHRLYKGYYIGEDQ